MVEVRYIIMASIEKNRDVTQETKIGTWEELKMEKRGREGGKGGARREMVRLRKDI